MLLAMTKKVILELLLPLLSVNRDSHGTSFYYLLAFSTKVKLKVLFHSFSVASLNQNSVSW